MNINIKLTGIFTVNTWSKLYLHTKLSQEILLLYILCGHCSPMQMQSYFGLMFSVWMYKVVLACN